MTVAVVGAHFCLALYKGRQLTVTGLDDTSCSSICPSYVFGHQWISCRTTANFVHTVANYGLGKDMWMVEPDNITNILYVSKFPLNTSFRVMFKHVQAIPTTQG